MTQDKVGTVLFQDGARGKSTGGLVREASRPSRRPEAQGASPDAGAAAHRGAHAFPRPGPSGAASPGRWAGGAGTRAIAARGAAGCQFPSPRAPHFPEAPPPCTERRRGAGRGGARPCSVSDWLLPLSIQNLFLMKGGCHPACPRSRLPLAANQSGLSPRATGDWGRVSSAPQDPVRVPPPPLGPEAVYPALPGHLPLVEAEQRPRCNAKAKCSEPGVAAGRSPWLGVWRGEGTRGAEEDCGGRGVMRRGGTLHPARPRAPAATRQVPPFLPSKGQVSRVGSGAGGWRRAGGLARSAFAESEPGEAGDATQLLLPLPGFGDHNTGLLCPLLRASGFRFASFIPGP